MQMKVIAHRGASMEAPENTLSAFKRAIELGVDFIECDVHMTKDKIPVVIHDNDIQGTPIDQLFLSELQKWDAGSWFLQKFSGEKVPTLNELLNVNFGKTGLMIEIKKISCPEDLLSICTLLEKKFELPFYIGSCNIEITQKLRELDSSLPLVGIATSEWELEDFISLDPTIMALRHQLITPTLIKQLHKQNIDVWCWTIDDPTYEIPGIDGVITNNVARFLKK